MDRRSKAAVAVVEELQKEMEERVLSRLKKRLQPEPKPEPKKAPAVASPEDEKGLEEFYQTVA